MGLIMVKLASIYSRCGHYTTGGGILQEGNVKFTKFPCELADGVALQSVNHGF